MESLIVGLVVTIVVLGLWVIIVPRDASEWVLWLVASVVAGVVAHRITRRLVS